MKRILVIGDSWAAGHVAETQTDIGWPEMAGIPDYLRQAVDGMTAKDWAADRNGCLTRAATTPCDAAIVCLGGNDIMYAGGKVTGALVSDILNALRAVLRRLSTAHPAVWAMTYANPYPDRKDTALAAAGLNFGIRLAAFGVAKVLESTALLTDRGDFAKDDFHPSLAGHRKLADFVIREIGQ